MPYRILVTGVGGPAGRSAARYFKSKGHTVIGTDIREIASDADEFISVPPALEAGYATSLLQIIRDRRPALLVPTVTEELLTVSRLKGEIEALGCMVPISSPSAVEVANDKLQTARFMLERGVSVPRTLGLETPRHDVARDLGLPLIAKPCFGRGGRGVSVHATLEDVMRDDRKGILFQEFIPGEEFDVNLFVADGAGARAAVSLRKTEMKEGLVGNAVTVVRDTNQEAVALCLRAASLLGLEGPLDFDVRLRKDGTPALLEINARLGGNSLHSVEVLDSLLGYLIEKTEDRLGASPRHSKA